MKEPPMHTLDVPVPPLLERALGYAGSATWVSFYWEPAGDEAMYDDGRAAGTGQWDAFLLYTRHRTVAPHLEGYDLGSSDAPAHHRLVLNRETRALFVAPEREAARHVRIQWPAMPGLCSLTAAEVERLSREYHRALREHLARPPAEIRSAVEERRAVHARELEALAAWLDARTQPGG
jgi:hypothetical protein